VSGHETLLAQIEILNSQLCRVLDALESPLLPSELQEQVKKLFANDIAQQLQRLNKLGSEVMQDQLIKQWVEFRQIRQACTPILHECLALIEGALMRQAGMDNGYCQIADSLLDDLSNGANIQWGRFTIPAKEEFFGDLAQVIRLRFPGAGFWDLPITVHEFGHFIGPQLKTFKGAGIFDNPFQTELKEAPADGELQWSFIYEYFADVFATYVLGPAYAYTCTILRFDPTDAVSDQGSARQSYRHPASAKRFYMICKTLELMNVEGYKGVIRGLKESWAQNLQSVEQTGQLEQQTIQSLDEFLNDRLYTLIDTKLLSIKYKDFSRVYGLSSRLLENEPGIILESEQYTLIDVLNAAWLHRIKIKNGERVALSQLEEKATNLCREILRRKV
jgi:hypothetical protein